MSSAILPTLLLTVSLVALFAAALVDLRHRIVPNRLVLVIATCGVGRRLWSAPGLIWFDLLAAASIVIVLGLLAHHEWIGGGDVKLIGAVALLFPLSDVGALLLSIAVAGGLMSCAYLAMRATVTKIQKPQFCSADAQKNTQDTMWGFEHLLRGERMRIAAGEPMPYALAVLGGVIYLIVSEAIQCLSATFCSL
jgi:prepilin peptidase CpaA